MTSDRVIMTRAATRAIVRGGRQWLRTIRGQSTTATARSSRGTAPDGRAVVLQPATARRSGAPPGFDVALVRCGGQHMGEVWERADLGTSTYEIVPRFDVGADAAVVTVALRLVVDNARANLPELRPAVRCPLDPHLHKPEQAVLAELGLTHIATFAGDPASPRAWPGEEYWSLPPEALSG